MKLMLACVIAVLLPSACTPSESPGPTNAESPPPSKSTATREGEERALADFIISPGAEGNVVEASSETTLTVGVRSWAFLVFPVPDVDVRCVKQATIRVFKGDRGGSFEDMAFYPSLEFDALKFRDGRPLGATTLLDNRPRGEFTEIPSDEGGWASFDITDLYVTWVSGDPFPNTDLGVPQGRPLVLQLRPTTEPVKTASFLSSEAGRKTAPTLKWLAVPNCQG